METHFFNLLHLNLKQMKNLLACIVVIATISSILTSCSETHSDDSNQTSNNDSIVYNIQPDNAAEKIEPPKDSPKGQLQPLPDDIEVLGKDALSDIILEEAHVTAELVSFNKTGSSTYTDGNELVIEYEAVVMYYEETYLASKNPAFGYELSCLDSGKDVSGKPCILVPAGGQAKFVGKLNFWKRSGKWVFRSYKNTPVKVIQ